MFILELCPEHFPALHILGKGSAQPGGDGLFEYAQAISNNTMTQNLPYLVQGTGR